MSDRHATLQVVSGGGLDSLHSVAKQSPKSHPIHLTPHLSTVQEEDVEMTDQADAVDLADRQADSTLSREQLIAAEQLGGTDDASMAQPLPEDLQLAEAFQVRFSCHVTHTTVAILIGACICPMHMFHQV